MTSSRRSPRGVSGKRPDELTSPTTDTFAVALRATDKVPLGHKQALRDLEAGAVVRKYGWPIGRLTKDVAAGGHVHSHNLETLLTGVEGYAYAPAPAAPLPQDKVTRFQGYRRPDGRVGTRNEIWILPTVGCVARTAERIAAIAHARHAKAVDGVFAFGHPHGCSQLGEDLDGTRSLLAALACHPNAGGVLLIGLGCESNQLDRLMEEIPESLRGRVRTLRAQSEEDESRLGSLMSTRSPPPPRSTPAGLPLGDLVVGLKCGGSDGFSGLTANPLVGRIADRVIGSGGAAILTEIPEIFGAERLLMARARDAATFDALVGVVNGFKRYYLAAGQPVSENPSPGNIEGGITTLEEKSLGAVQKAGRAPVADVLLYGKRIRRRPEHSRGAGQRRSFSTRWRRRRDPHLVHHRPRHADGLPRADGEDRHQQRARPAQARLDRFRRGQRAGRRLRGRRGGADRAHRRDRVRRTDRRRARRRTRHCDLEARRYALMR